MIADRIALRRPKFTFSRFQEFRNATIWLKAAASPGRSGDFLQRSDVTHINFLLRIA